MLSLAHVAFLHRSGHLVLGLFHLETHVLEVFWNYFIGDFLPSVFCCLFLDLLLFGGWGSWTNALMFSSFLPILYFWIVSLYCVSLCLYFLGGVTALYI